MAHSNRKKLKAARGGKTRHQAAKEARKAYKDPQQRIKELEQWQEDRLVGTSPTPTTVKKVKTYKKKGHMLKKRTLVANKLNAQLKCGMKSLQPKHMALADAEELFEAEKGHFLVPLTPKDEQRIQKEIDILVTRGAVLTK